MSLSTYMTFGVHGSQPCALVPMGRARQPAGKFSR
jgi:hypothetical protein